MAEQTGRITGKCHCGRVSLSVRFLVDSVTKCNCSICRRVNAVWGYYQRKEVDMDIAEGTAVAHLWNDKMIEFMHCGHCGCTTHYQDIEKTPDSRVGINFRMFPDEYWSNIRVRYFDGADTFQECRKEDITNSALW